MSAGRWEPTSAGEVVVARWWRGEYGLRGRVLQLALAPAEVLFRAGVWLRNSAYDAGILAVTRAEIPVVSVGNLTIGGAGKTPVAAFLVEELRRRGLRPALLHGGFADDEPQLHRQWHPDVPVFAEKDRIEAASRAVACGATVVVLDDGFQHRRIAKNLEIVLVAAESWTAQPKLLPRGPWRESPSSLRRADLIAVTRKTGTADFSYSVAREVSTLAPDVPIACLHLRADRWRRSGETDPPSGPALAVAGVASPNLFAENARAAGADITEVVVFPDHHEYTQGDVQRIRSLARGRPVVTTEKDNVKLATLMDASELWVLGQRVDIELGGDVLASALDRLASA
jgi:tetraacyldisaccharide 4'-kinase